MATTIKTYNQPDVGEGTVEVDILEWSIAVGDSVSMLQTIGRGKYEKADIDILAPAYSGTVHRICVPAGNVAIVGQPLIEFAVEEEELAAPKSATNIASATLSKQTKQNSVGIESATAKPSVSILALPATKHYAKEHSIDLSLVTGTGKDGRILKEDVMAFQNQQTQQKSAPIIATQSVTAESEAEAEGEGDRVERIVGVKKAMARKMTEANGVPQFGYADEIILNALIALRARLKPLGEREGVKLTYLPLILKAVSLALRSSENAFSGLNAHVNGECTEVTHRRAHNLGVAIDSAEGLIVPNIKNVQTKSVFEIACDLDALVQRGRSGRLTSEDISGGTLTLSNIGAIGGTYCSPICFVPEVCIGALGAIQTLPRYDANGELFRANVMAVAWSADHRVIDGATLARFANEFKRNLEQPDTMLLHLK